MEEDPSKEGVLEGIEEIDDKFVLLDLEFLFSKFLREGAEIHLRVVKGVPLGAKAQAAGIFDGTLVVVFDQKVPQNIYFEDLAAKSITELN